VENTYQYQLLMGMGCESLQGFWFSKPLPQQDFLQLICTWRGQSTGTS
jgi:EAL domain-containing protein (putative c-di-GMP-specific phosphodiesterase class I)